MKKTALVLMVLFTALVLVVAAPACKSSKRGESPEEAEQAKLDSEVSAEAAAAEAAAKPVPPASRMSEDVYVEIRARTALIFEKYKDDMVLAEQTVGELYEKFLVTQQEFKTWEAKQTMEKRSALEKKVMDFMQKILGEYR
jgi:hypothetical protein